MIGVTVTISPDLRTIGVAISGVVQNRSGLNEVLAQRLVDELQDHFRQKKALPNNRVLTNT